ncbi:MAG: NADH-quinone oxidoreductase subunit J [Sulfurospirillum sp.]|nr:NADH-quinone oxidoreductase subunit J [Sulfurospirillum sp.]
MIDIIFFTLAIFTLAGGIGTISFSQPIYSAMSLIVSIIAMAGIFALLSAPFLFLVQIIIYAGAIITLLVFIIMFLNVKNEHLPKEENKNIHLTLSAFLLIPLVLVSLKAFNTLPLKSMEIMSGDFGSIKLFGMTLFQGWLVPFELISILLLCALIGAVVYARKEDKIG